MSELKQKLEELEKQVQEGTFAIHEIVKTTGEVFGEKWPTEMSIPQDWNGQMPVTFEYKKDAEEPRP